MPAMADESIIVGKQGTIFLGGPPLVRLQKFLVTQSLQKIVLLAVLQLKLLRRSLVKYFQIFSRLV